jgi:hypothetical protein
MQGGPPGTFTRIATVTTNTYTEYGLSVGGTWHVYYKIKAVDTQSNASDFSNMLTLTSSGWFKEDVVEEPSGLPGAYQVSEAYPNPFNPETRIDFTVPEPSEVSLIVYDLLGREIAVLARGFYPSGDHTALWSGSTVSSGVYIARFTAVDGTGAQRLNETLRLMLVK